MNACEVWLRRDYLLRHGHQPDEPPCGHDPDDCPPDQPVSTDPPSPRCCANTEET